jgi:squalene synthase HpnC
MADGAVSARRSGDSRTLRHREHGENFPVALTVLPRRLRADLHAVYGFARTVDDLGDRAAGDRTAQLHEFRDDLAEVWGSGRPELPVHQRLVEVVRRHELDQADFQKLVEANLQDQVVSRYETPADLLGYCELSANPVGRIVLGVFDCSTPERVTWSDAVCSALQLLEHWQDVREDALAGRIYLPMQDLRAHGVDPAELTGTTAGRQLRNLVRTEVDRAAAMLDEGAPLVGDLRGWAKIAVAGFVAGGRATVLALRRTEGDVLARPARPRRTDTARRMLRELVR